MPADDDEYIEDGRRSLVVDNSGRDIITHQSSYDDGHQYYPPLDSLRSPEEDDRSEGVGHGSLPRPDGYDRSEGVGYGSLPRPEEHFAPRTTAREHHSSDLQASGAHHPALEGDPDDENYGLAVATAVAPDDEPEYVYNAIEYDPDAKPPLHRNRRFRLYTYFALGLIASEYLLTCIPSCL